MSYQHKIKIQLADGDALEYSTTMRYTDNRCVGYSTIKDFIREKTGKNNFDLYDEEGIKQLTCELVYALVLVCVFKPDICESCKMTDINLSGDGICYECWKKSNTNECTTGVNLKKFYYLENHPTIYCYKVYFNDDLTQAFIKTCDKDMEKIDYFDHDTLMYDGNRVVLLSEIPEEFIPYYDTVYYDSVIE
jgi:hypothetical protein